MQITNVKSIETVARANAGGDTVRGGMASGTLMRAVLSTVCMRVLMGLSVVVRHRVAVHVVVWFIVLALPLLADSWTFLGMFVVLLMVLDLVVILVVLQVLICATLEQGGR